MTKGDGIASFVLQNQGYLVVGIVIGGTIPAIGSRLHDWCHLPLSQPIVIIAETTREDWDAQNRLVAPWKDDPEIPRDPEIPCDFKGRRNVPARYFKAMTD